MTPEMEEFKDKVDDLLWGLESLPDTSDYAPPEYYVAKMEEALNHIWEAQSILQKIMDEFEEEN